MLDGGVFRGKVFVNVNVKVNVVGGSGEAGSFREGEGERDDG